MKKYHLLCNAHLDPAWLWQRDEGLVEAISTFRVAADFCEKKDHFVFNHNEALLYEFIEEYEPELFKRIQKLVAEKKWVITGGWYLQPDCNMPSGESFLSQIKIGNEYFMKKFGVKPDTALNYDSFGHTRGLVQILAKTGYKHYVHMRPDEMKRGNFWWEGFDGSKILLHHMYGGYGNTHGTGLTHVKSTVDKINNGGEEIGLIHWGIGNHGGGPSELDLNQIDAYIEENKDNFEMLHSNYDNYFAELDTSNLDTVKESLVPSMVGCYTSIVRVKQGNRSLENKIAMTEKIMAYAALSYGLEPDYEKLTQAKKNLAFCQFHDLLPGSHIENTETETLNKLGAGEDIAYDLFLRSFVKLCEGEKKTPDGELPIIVFNPHPYEVEGIYEVEFTMPAQNWNDGEFTYVHVFDVNGNEVTAQNEQTYCSMNLDWRKHVTFRAKLNPSGITRFNCRLDRQKTPEFSQDNYAGDFITVENDRMTVRINKKTGLIDLYKVDGKTLIENSGKIEVYDDNEDAWGMCLPQWGMNPTWSYTDCLGAFEPMTVEEANEFTGYPDEKYGSVRVTEDGPVRIKIQSLLKYNRSAAVVEYSIPKNGTYFDVKIRLFSNEPNKMIKYHVDSSFSGKPYGETAFGYQELFSDEKESVYQKWCGIKSENSNLYIINKGIYGGSFTENAIKLSLLRTPLYSGHPIVRRPFAPHDRYTNHIDMGMRVFEIRITSGENIQREAMEFNEAPYALSFFPSGNGTKRGSFITIDNPDVFLTSIEKKDTGYVLHLHNFADKENDAEIELKTLGKKLKLHFGVQELKFVEI